MNYVVINWFIIYFSYCTFRVIVNINRTRVRNCNTSSLCVYFINVYIFKWCTKSALKYLKNKKLNMPQLDRVIVFTQLFWLITVFVILYIILTHIFLPILIKSFKIRSLFIQFIKDRTNKIQSNLLFKQKFIAKTLNNSLLISKSLLCPKFKPYQRYLHLINFNLLNFQLFTFILYIALYCSKPLINSILLSSKNFSFKFNKLK